MTDAVHILPIEDRDFRGTPLWLRIKDLSLGKMGAVLTAEAQECLSRGDDRLRGPFD